jgi:hypothetical protein
MDHFEHAFIAVRRKAEEEESLRSELQITKEEAAILILRLLILNYFLKMDLPLKDEIGSVRKEVNYFLKNWITRDEFNDIAHEFKVLIKEGSQSKLKLNLLKNVFDEHFIHIYDIVAFTHNGYFEEKSGVGVGAANEGPGELQGIEVFRNRQDGLRSFTINQYDSRGLECIVMFKKGLKKFELCENLANR